MESTVETLEDSKVRIAVTVSADEVDDFVKRTYARLAKEISVPGFRKGHAPRRVVDNLVGVDRVLGEVQELVVNETYPVALDKDEIRPVTDPEFGDIPLPEEGHDYSYEAEVTVRPEMTLSSYEGLVVTVEPDEVSDDDVERQVENMRDRLSTLELVEDRGLEPGDFAVLSFVWTIDGEEFEGGSVEQYLYEFGKGQMPQEFEDQLMGAESDDERTVQFEIPTSSSNPEYVGKIATFQVTVHEVKRKILAELSDEFATAAGGYDTVEDMRADIRSQLERVKRANYVQQVEVEARRALAENLEGDVPVAMIRKRVEDMVQDLVSQLEMSKTTFDQYVASLGMTKEQYDIDLETKAVESLRTEFALEALFRALDVEVTDADLDTEVGQLANSPDQIPELRERFERSGLMQVIGEQAMQRKATMWLMDNVEVIGGESPKDMDLSSPAEAAEDESEDAPEADAEDAGAEDAS